MGEAPPARTAELGVIELPPSRRTGASKKPRRVHPGVIAAMVLVVLALPLLVLGHGAKAKTNTQQAAASRDTGATTTSDTAASANTEAPGTEAPSSEVPTTAAPTTAPPTSVTPVTAPKAAQAAAPVTAPKPVVTAPAPKPAPAPTTTVAPKAAAPKVTQSQSGQGTWYRYKPGGCANNSLPMGTVVTVTDVDNGATATCVVNDRGSFGYPRILDMDASVFQQLAPLDAGVINIRISW